MKFTSNQEVKAELSMRSLSDKAQVFYSGTDPLTVYEVDTDEGPRYYVRGCLEYDEMTFEDLNQTFEAMMDSFETEEAQDRAREIIGDGLYDAAVNLMDDEIRESLHAELSPCTEEEFLAAYIIQHKAKFNEDFEV